jgi:hypothetical protein
MVSPKRKKVGLNGEKFGLLLFMFAAKLQLRVLKAGYSFAGPLS